MDFELIETILWENGEYFLSPLHVARLKRSAEYFNFEFSDKLINTSLTNTAKTLSTSLKYRIRLVLKKIGGLTITVAALEELPALPVKIAFSIKEIDKNDIFLKHKTTNRSLYDSELEKCRKNGLFDVIFTNQDKEITEGSITNIMIRRNGTYYTPPLSCGLLPGIYREYILKEQELPVKEKILYRKDIVEADEIMLINSVRKIVPAVLA